MRLTKAGIKSIRDAAKLSAGVITRGKLTIETDYGRKTSTGIANIFLNQLELQLNLHKGRLQIDP